MLVVRARTLGGRRAIHASALRSVSLARSIFSVRSPGGLLSPPVPIPRFAAIATIFPWLAMPFRFTRLSRIPSLWRAALARPALLAAVFPTATRPAATAATTPPSALASASAATLLVPHELLEVEERIARRLLLRFL